MQAIFEIMFREKELFDPEGNPPLYVITLCIGVAH